MGADCRAGGAASLYRILEPEFEEIELSPERPGVVEPEVPHEVEPAKGGVRFRVDFYR